MRYIGAAFECSDTCKRRAKRCNWECFSIHHDSAFPACNTRRHWISFSFQTLMCMQWNAASQTRKQTHRQEMCHKTQLCYKLHWISAQLWLCSDIFPAYYSVTPRLCHVAAVSRQPFVAVALYIGTYHMLLHSHTFQHIGFCATLFAMQIHERT